MQDVDGHYESDLIWLNRHWWIDYTPWWHEDANMRTYSEYLVAVAYWDSQETIASDGTNGMLKVDTELAMREEAKNYFNKSYYTRYTQDKKYNILHGQFTIQVSAWTACRTVLEQFPKVWKKKQVNKTVYICVNIVGLVSLQFRYIL